MPNADKIKVSKQELLIYMTSLYYDNRGKENIAEIISDPNNYKILDAKADFSIWSKDKIYEYLDADTKNFFDTVSSLKKEGLKQLFEKQKPGKPFIGELLSNLEQQINKLNNSVQEELLQSPYNLSYTETPILLDNDHVPLGIKMEESGYKHSYEFARKAKNYLMNQFMFGHDSSVEDTMKPVVEASYFTLYLDKAAYQILDPEKAQGYKYKLDYPSNKEEFEWRTNENGKIEIKQRYNWQEVEYKDGRLIIKGRELNAALNATIEPYPPVQDETIKVQCGPSLTLNFSEYTPEQLTMLKNIKDRYNDLSQTLESKLNLYTALHKDEIKHITDTRVKKENEGLRKIVNEFDDKFRAPAKDYDIKTFEEYKSFKENSDLFDNLKKLYDSLPNSIDIHDDALRNKVIKEILEKYFNLDNEKDFLLKDMSPQSQQKFLKVVDILKDKLNGSEKYPEIKDREFFDVLHQIDYELKTKFRTPDTKYMKPLNGSRCPSCDETFKNLIDNILEKNQMFTLNSSKELEQIVSTMSKGLSKTEPENIAMAEQSSQRGLC